jgi:hypothetical protein
MGDSVSSPRLPNVRRAVVAALRAGERGSDVARKFGVSKQRVSQIRLEERIASPRPAPVGPSELTRVQAEILAFVIGCVEERGYPPTAREIASHFGWRSTNGVYQQLQALERKGRLAMDHAAARTIRIPGVRWRMVPIEQRKAG